MAKPKDRLTGGNRAEIVARLLLEDGNLCRYCKRSLAEVGATIEHLIPTSRGGSDYVENLALTCHECNNEKDSLTDEEYIAFLAGENFGNCGYCGSVINPRFKYCGNHGKRFALVKRRTPFYAQALLEASPELRRELYRNARGE